MHMRDRAVAADLVFEAKDDVLGRLKQTLARRRRRRGSLQGVLYVLPAALLTAAFLAYPVFETVRLAFYDWNGIDPSQVYVGWANFSELFNEDPYFWQAVKNTVLWGLVTVPLELILGLSLAIMLDRKIRFRAGFRAIFFLPAVMSPVVIAIAWNTIYSPTSGIANSVSGFLGFGSHIGWLGDPRLALWSAALASIWRYAGLIMVFYLAGLQTIPASLYEAARVDGASEWKQIRQITLPLLKPMTVLLILLGTIGAVREFDMIWILTGGGPAHRSDLLSVQVFTNAFQTGRVGYASAIATIMLFATIIAAALELAYLARVQRSIR
jgi:raffinose/stachyose/melibiose transport system permease protein